MGETRIAKMRTDVYDASEIPSAEEMEIFPWLIPREPAKAVTAVQSRRRIALSIIVSENHTS